MELAEAAAATVIPRHCDSSTGADKDHYCGCNKDPCGCDKKSPAAGMLAESTVRLSDTCSAIPKTDTFTQKKFF